MTWADKPMIHNISDKNMLKESAVIISDRTQLEVGKAFDGNLAYTRRRHKIVKVNDEKGIELFNKIKIRDPK